MTKAQQVFEAMMRAKGFTDFNQVKNKYTDPNMVMRWNYFLMGWEMRGIQ